MSDTVEVSKLPQCNFCNLPARYDSALIAGAWAYVCTEHWVTYTNKKLGTGYGQRLVLKGKTEKDFWTNT